MDLAHSLMEKGQLMDCGTKLQKAQASTKVQQKEGISPCECGLCFFCKYRITHGVQHEKPRVPKFCVPLPG
jgi:hypothetical protein